MKVLDVPQQELPRVEVPRGIDRLGKVDHDGPLVGHQDVELRKISVDHTSAEHADDFSNQRPIDAECLVRFEDEIPETWRGFAPGIANELHHEDALDEVDRLGNPDTGFPESMDRIDLGTPPGRLVPLAAMSTALQDGALVPGIAAPPTFRVFGTVSERPLVRRLVDLRDAFGPPRTDHEDLGLLAAHERPDDFLDDAMLDQRFEACGRLHSSKGSRGAGVQRRPMRSYSTAFPTSPSPERVAAMRRDFDLRVPLEKETDMTTVRTDPLEEGILRVTLERPERLNAISSGLLADLHATLDRLAVDRETRVVILTGAGRGFCSGADLGQRDGPGAIPGTEGMSPLGFVYRYQESLAEVMLKIHELPQPVIAAVNGVAVGGGLALALASDIRFASTEASFGSAFIKAGLSSCDVGTSYFLPRLIHPGDAAELMLTGRIFDAEEARRLGLLQDLVAPEALQDRALETARLIRNNNEYGVWMTKKGLWTNLDAPSLRHAMEIENRTQVLGCFTGNMEEAMKAFVEKRPPNWKRL